jgi:hypothetical protein
VTDLGFESSNYAVVLYYDDIQVEVAQGEVRFRRVDPNFAGGDGDGAGEVVASFSGETFADIIKAVQLIQD